MRIRWHSNGQIQSGFVDRKIGQVYVTRRNEQVHENEVIASDSRGGGRMGSGRKPKIDKSLQVYSYVPPGIKEYLELESTRQNKTVSELILEAIELWKNRPE